MIKHLINYAPAKLIPGLINFLALMLYARLFTKQEYGNYSYVMSYLVFIQAVLFSWIRLSSFRFYNIYVEKYGKNFYLSYVSSVYLILSVLLVIGFALFVNIYRGTEGLGVLFLLGSFMVIVSAYYEQSMSFLRVQLLSKSFAIYSIVRPVLRLLVILICVYTFHLDEKAIIIGMISANFILLIKYYWDLRNKEKFQFDIKALRANRIKDINNHFLKYGLPLTLSFLFTIILSSSDRIFIKYYIDSEAVAIYSLGYDLSTFVITNVFMVLNFSFIPVIMRALDSNNIQVAYNKIKDYFSLMIIIVVPVAMFMFLFAPFIAKYLLGESYNNPLTIKTIELITISAFLAGIKAYFFDFSFQFGKKTTLQIYPIIIGGILNIILNIVLIPIYGVSGAIYATIISYLFALIISILIGNSTFKMRFDSKYVLKAFFELGIIFVIFSVLERKEIDIANFLFNLILYVLLCGIFVVINFKTFKRILLK